MPTVVTLTVNSAVDESCVVDHVVPDRKLRCQSVQREPGGGGINVSRAIWKLGEESLAFYMAGGPTGQMLQHLLDQEGLQHRPLPTENWTRESLTVFEDGTDLQFRFNMPGPLLQEQEWQQSLDQLAQVQPSPEYLVASGSLPPGVPPDFYARVARLAKKQGSRLILDASGEPLRLALEEGGLYLIKPNLREFRELVGSVLADEVQQEKMVMRLVEQGQSQVVVVSLGAAGVLLGWPDGCERLRAPTVPIRSKVGAGDSTVAGIVLSLVRGHSIRDAVRFGVAAGAAAVMTPGTELCRREDTERLYRMMVARENETGT